MKLLTTDTSKQPGALSKLIKTLTDVLVKDMSKKRIVVIDFALESGFFDSMVKGFAAGCTDIIFESLTKVLEKVDNVGIL